ncbi:hypothetical protein [Xanthomonas oryzae]|uniref:hypothetical protein n=1 Tax=Xanthomonas oryzae TaxID=347 RepID=UPI0012B2D6AA|nr:hypothetical protein [Xanthomonas oryzae]
MSIGVSLMAFPLQKIRIFTAPRSDRAVAQGDVMRVDRCCDAMDPIEHKALQPTLAVVAWLGQCADVSLCAGA